MTDETEEPSAQLVADAWGLVLKVRQFTAGNCTREDVLRFAYEKGLFSREEDALEALRQVLENEPVKP